MTEAMTISLALRKIAELKGEVGRHKVQAMKSTHWETTSCSPFDWHEEVKALEKLKSELCTLKARVAAANSLVIVDGHSLQEWIFRLAEIKDTITMLEAVPAGVTNDVKRTENRNNYVSGQYITEQVEKITHFVFSEKEKADRLAELRIQANQINQLLERHNHLKEI